MCLRRHRRGCGAGSDDLGRIASHHLSGKNVLDHNGAGANDRAVPDPHAGTDKGVRTHTDVIADGDRYFQQGELGFLVVMGARAQKGPL